MSKGRNVPPAIEDPEMARLKALWDRRMRKVLSPAELKTFQDYHRRCEQAGDVLPVDDALTAVYARLNEDAEFVGLQTALAERGKAIGLAPWGEARKRTKRPR